MKIYIGHSSNIDFKEELYKPLKESELAEEHDLVFPHEDSDDLFDSKSFLRNEADLFIAEVSEASTGLGIELGWADQFNVPVICIYSKDSKPTSSLKAVTDNIKSYEDNEELINLIRENLEQN